MGTGYRYNVIDRRKKGKENQQLLLSIDLTVLPLGISDRLTAHGDVSGADKLRPIAIAPLLIAP